MRIHSYTGPLMEDGADYPQLEINVELLPTGFPNDDYVHWCAIKIVSQPLVDIFLPLLKFLGIPKHSHAGASES